MNKEEFQLNNGKYMIHGMKYIPDNPKNIPETYFIIYILDNKLKRALYKSQEYYVKNIVSNTIKLDNEYFCEIITISYFSRN